VEPLWASAQKLPLPEVDGFGSTLFCPFTRSTVLGAAEARRRMGDLGGRRSLPTYTTSSGVPATSQSEVSLLPSFPPSLSPSLARTALVTLERCSYTVFRSFHKEIFLLLSYVVYSYEVLKMPTVLVPSGGQQQGKSSTVSDLELCFDFSIEFK
jgi:hypothetical protein